MLFSLVHKMNWVFLLVLLLSSVGKCDEDNTEDENDKNEEDQETVEEEEDPVAKAVNFKPPKGMQALRFRPANLTAEEHFSLHMPLDLMCDGCRIIAYQATRRLKRIQDRYKKGHRLLESDIIDILDEMCNGKDSFHDYGIKEVNGKKRLAGDGLETKDVPGMLQGGGNWPHRLREMCEQYIGNLGEDVIYSAFLENKSLEQFLCYSEENGNVCSPKPTKETKESKKEL